MSRITCFVTDCKVCDFLKWNIYEIEALKYGFCGIRLS